MVLIVHIQIKMVSFTCRDFVWCPTKSLQIKAKFQFGYEKLELLIWKKLS